MPDLFHPIRIVIDGNEANCEQRVGSNVYAWEILRAMHRLMVEQRRGFRVTVLLSRPPVVWAVIGRWGSGSWRRKGVQSIADPGD